MLIWIKQSLQILGTIVLLTLYTVFSSITYVCKHIILHHQFLITPYVLNRSTLLIKLIGFQPYFILITSCDDISSGQLLYHRLVSAFLFVFVLPSILHFKFACIFKVFPNKSLETHFIPYQDLLSLSLYFIKQSNQH